MANRLEGFPSQEERDERREILEEMKEVAKAEQPAPEENWDLVWVLSGENESINEVPRDDKRNETRDRVETALNLVKEVTALRSGKKAEDVTAQEISERGPSVYFNGVVAQNTNLKSEIALNWNFPVEKIVISNAKDIENTGDQFEEIPAEILDGKRKVVIVSSLYHFPRLKRYVQKHSDKMNPDQVVLYAAEPKGTPFRKTLAEIKKIPKYRKQGILPKK